MTTFMVNVHVLNEWNVLYVPVIFWQEKSLYACMCLCKCLWKALVYMFVMV